MPEHDNTSHSLLWLTLACEQGLITPSEVRPTLDAQRLSGIPLVGILVDSGMLTALQCGLVDRLLQEELERHNGDVALCLADRLARNNPVPKNSSAKFGSVRGSGISPLSDTVETDDPTVRKPRFRILSPHARGGLGEVSVAVDRQLHRKVALKQLHPNLANSEEMRRRFEVEAEITGSLEHPGIVPVYALGVDTDGRLYYAMRFIEGDSIEDLIASFHSKPGDINHPEKLLEFRGLLGRFIDVCETIDYAHSRGVIHRDIKPCHIMLGKFGETLVVDWGLAKVVGTGDSQPAQDETDEISSLGLPLASAGTDLTAHDAIKGTPRYMSPEQAAGRIDSIGKASDIYSLGATLYTLLTGKPAFSGPTREEIRRRVLKGEFTKPRQVVPSVPPALEAICIKALAYEPENRYATPRELANQIERWLADEPVSEFPDPLITRAGRWVRRHKPLASAIAVLTIVSTISLAAIALVVNSERKISDKSFELAKQSADEMLAQVSESSLMFKPGFIDLRRKLNQKFITFYEELIKQRPNEITLRTKMAFIRRAWANTLRLIGKFDESLGHTATAIQLQKQLIDMAPKDKLAVVNLAHVYIDHGEGLWFGGRRNEAIDSFNEAAKLMSPFDKLDPNSEVHMRTIARSQADLGDTQLEFGKLDEANASYTAGADRLRKIMTIDADTKTHFMERLMIMPTLTGRAVIAAWRKDASTAARFDEALRMSDSLLDLGPTNPDAMFYSAMALNERGDWLIRQANNPAQALADFENAVTLAREVSEQFPTTIEYQLELASALNGQARVQLTHSKPILSMIEAELSEARKILDSILTDHPDYPKARRRLCQNIELNAALAQTQGDKPKADALKTVATEEWRRVASAFPANPDIPATTPIKAKP